MAWEVKNRVILGYKKGMQNMNSSAGNSAVASFTPAQVVEARAIADAAHAACPGDSPVMFAVTGVLCPACPTGKLYCSPAEFREKLHTLRRDVATRRDAGYDRDLFGRPRLAVA